MKNKPGNLPIKTLQIPKLRLINSELQDISHQKKLLSSNEIHRNKFPKSSFEKINTKLKINSSLFINENKNLTYDFNQMVKDMKEILERKHFQESEEIKENAVNLLLEKEKTIQVLIEKLENQENQLRIEFEEMLKHKENDILKMKSNWECEKNELIEKISYLETTYNELEKEKEDHFGQIELNYNKKIEERSASTISNPEDLAEIYKKENQNLLSQINELNTKIKTEIDKQKRLCESTYNRKEQSWSKLIEELSHKNTELQKKNKKLEEDITILKQRNKEISEELTKSFQLLNEKVTDQVQIKTEINLLVKKYEEKLLEKEEKYQREMNTMKVQLDELVSNEIENSNSSLSEVMEKNEVIYKRTDIKKIRLDRKISLSTQIRNSSLNNNDFQTFYNFNSNNNRGNNTWRDKTNKDSEEKVGFNKNNLNGDSFIESNESNINKNENYNWEEDHFENFNNVDFCNLKINKGDSVQISVNSIEECDRKTSEKEVNISQKMSSNGNSDNSEDKVNIEKNESNEEKNEENEDNNEDKYNEENENKYNEENEDKYNEENELYSIEYLVSDKSVQISNRNIDLIDKSIQNMLKLEPNLNEIQIYSDYLDKQIEKIEKQLIKIDTKEIPSIFNNIAGLNEKICGHFKFIFHLLLQKTISKLNSDYMNIIQKQEKAIINVQIENEIGTENSGFIQYLILIEDKIINKKWRFYTRYSQLLEFHQNFVKNLPKNLVNKAPNFPKKLWVSEVFFCGNSNKKSLLNLRRNGLENYLSNLISDPNNYDIVDYSNIQGFLLFEIKKQLSIETNKLFENCIDSNANINEISSLNKTQVYKTLNEEISQIKQKKSMLIKEIENLDSREILMLTNQVQDDININ